MQEMKPYLQGNFYFQKKKKYQILPKTQLLLLPIHVKRTGVSTGFRGDK